MEDFKSIAGTILKTGLVFAAGVLAGVVIESMLNDERNASADFPFSSDEPSPADEDGEAAATSASEQEQATEQDTATGAPESFPGYATTSSEPSPA